MRRREVVAGVASLAALGGGGLLLSRGVPSTGTDADPDGSDGTGSGDDPFTVETVDAPGSAAGTVRVPEGPTLLEFFATNCGACRSKMPELAVAHEELGDRVSFLSLTVEPTIEDAELAAWWADHDGSWTVGRDPNFELGGEYGVIAYPTSVLVDAEGDRLWISEGDVLPAEEVVAEIEGALEEPTTS